MKNVDLVYILGSGSHWQNNEIRYSFRSVEKNLKGVGRVWVIGENPGFLSDKVRHIYYPDEIGGRNADGNMTRKILRACRENELTDDFLFMNDDFIIYKPIVAAEIPWMHKGDMKQRDQLFWTAQFYRHRLRRTFEVLQSRNMPTMQYDYHAPMLMNKHRFPEVMAKFDYASDIGYTFRSLYGNSLALPASLVNGRKVTIYRKYDYSQLDNMTKNSTFVGYNDAGLSTVFKRWLQEKFPEMSTYELPPVTKERSMAVKAWFESGCDYDEGVRIFEAYTLKNARLVKYFHSKKDTLSKKRLIMTLRPWI